MLWARRIAEVLIEGDKFDGDKFDGDVGLIGDSSLKTSIKRPPNLSS